MWNPYSYSAGIVNGYGEKTPKPMKSSWVLQEWNVGAGIHKGRISRAWKIVAERKENRSRNRSSRIRMKNGVDDNQDHYAVLGLTTYATSTDIKRAFRHLARQYHPDVNKELDADNSFKSIRLAYEVLSNETTRTEYDKVLRLQESDMNSHWRNWAESEFNVERRYSWSELKQHIRHRNWEQNRESSKNSFSSFEDGDFGEENMEEREPIGDFLRRIWFMIFCSQAFGSHTALTLFGFYAILNRRMALGYKVAHVVAWVIGGHRGFLLILGLSFTSWFCGKAYDGLVALISLALWVGVDLVKFVPLPQGAILAMTYMCFKLQIELS